MPTSLTHIVACAIPFSGRGPDAVSGTAPGRVDRGRGSGVSRAIRRVADGGGSAPRSAGRMAGSRVDLFPSDRTVPSTRKEDSRRVAEPQSPSPPKRRRCTRPRRAGILTRFPFAPRGPPRGVKDPRLAPRGPRSGLTYSRRFTLPVKPFPSSAVRTPTALVATGTKICTGGGSRGGRPPPSAPAPPRLPTRPPTPGGRLGLSGRFHRHPFSPLEA